MKEKDIRPLLTPLVVSGLIRQGRNADRRLRSELQQLKPVALKRILLLMPDDDEWAQLFPDTPSGFVSDGGRIYPFGDGGRGDYGMVAEMDVMPCCRAMPSDAACEEHSSKPKASRRFGSNRFMKLKLFKESDADSGSDDGTTDDDNSIVDALNRFGGYRRKYGIDQTEERRRAELFWPLFDRWQEADTPASLLSAVFLLVDELKRWRNQDLVERVLLSLLTAISLTVNPLHKEEMAHYRRLVATMMELYS
jgi:hypothetical protein